MLIPGYLGFDLLPPVTYAELLFLFIWH